MNQVLTRVQVQGLGPVVPLLLKASVSYAVTLQSYRSGYHPPRVPTPRQIVARVAGLRGLRPEDLYGTSTIRRVAHARQEAMWEMRKWKRANGTHYYSLPRIGTQLQRDHSTVLHGIRRHEERLANGEVRT